MKDSTRQTGFRMQSKNLPIWREAFGGIDWLLLRLSPTYQGSGISRGDGSPVIVVPGCFATDKSLHEMHSWLSRIGYKPYYSGIGRNVRCPAVSVEMLVETIEEAYRQTGKKVTLIGHSLGGLIARGAAMRAGHAVSHVITLGTPVRGIVAHPLMLAAADLFRGSCDYQCLPSLQADLPDGMRETNIYSSDDGVVDPRACHRVGTERIRVHGTHVGLTVNAQVYEAIAGILTNLRQPKAVSQTKERNVSFQLLAGLR